MKDDITLLRERALQTLDASVEILKQLYRLDHGGQSMDRVNGGVDLVKRLRQSEAMKASWARRKAAR